MENVFGDEDDEEEEVQLPKNAKKSNNIGRDTITSQGPNSFGKNRKTGFTNDNSFSNKIYIIIHVLFLNKQIK